MVPGNTVGWRRIVGSSITNLGAYSAGQKRFELGSASLVNEGGSPTAAMLFGAGNSTTRVDGTGTRFINFSLQFSGNSSFSQGLQVDLKHTGTSTESEAIRAFERNAGTVTSGSLHGLWSTFNVETGGTNSGLNAAGRFTMTATASVNLTGTTACLQLDATYAASNTLAGNEYFIRCENVGANKIGQFLQAVALDTTACFVTVSGSVAKGLKCNINGSVYYIMLSTS